MRTSGLNLKGEKGEADSDGLALATWDLSCSPQRVGPQRNIAGKWVLWTLQNLDVFKALLFPESEQSLNLGWDQEYAGACSQMGTSPG